MPQAGPWRVAATRRRSRPEPERCRGHLAGSERIKYQEPPGADPLEKRDMPVPEIDRVSMVDLSAQYNELRSEIDAAVTGVIEGGRYILGPQVRAFETEFADHADVTHCVGVANGTDALDLAVGALGLKAGDRVLTTSFTFIATADAFARCGIMPVFADIDPQTYNLDPSSVADRITPEVKAIIAVHLFGQPADMDGLLQVARDRNVPLIEDCAQAHGALYLGRRVGSLGTMSTFSFFPTKPLGCAGDGGCVCTDDGALAGRVRMLRSHGSNRKYIHEELGMNSRLDEIQAAVLRVKLPRLDAWNESRRAIASEYDSRLEGVQVPTVARGRDHVYHQYTVRTPERDRLRESMEKAGVGSTVYYPVPLHLQPCFASLGYRRGDLPECERASREVLSLPIYHGMPRGHLERVCEAVNGAFH